MDGGAWWATVHGIAKSQTRLSDFTFTFHFHALEKEMATHSSVLAWRIPGMGAWWAAVYGAAQSRTRLKRLSNSSSSSRGSYLQSWLNLSISFLFILTCHALELLPRSGVETLPEIDFCPCVYPGFLPACFSLHPPSHIFFMILFFQPCPLVTGTLIFPINKLSYIHHSKTDYLYTYFLELKPGHANFLVTH